MLDVGCGGGHFVKSCQNAGLNCDGIEISDDSINFAKEVFELDLIHGDLNSTKIEKKYDLITLWGIIEHVENPVQLIKSCKKYLTNQKLKTNTDTEILFHLMNFLIFFQNLIEKNTFYCQKRNQFHRLHFHHNQLLFF